MGIFLQDFIDMPSVDKFNLLKNDSNKLAAAIVFDMRTYNGGESLSKKAFPFLTKSFKDTTFNVFNDKTLNRKLIDIRHQVNFYRLFKDESFSDKLLKNTINQTFLMDTEQFKHNKSLISTFYVSTMFHNGNTICDKNFVIRDSFVDNMRKKGALSIFPTIACAVPFKKNLKKLDKINATIVALNFNSRDEINIFNSLVEKNDDNIFIKDMALEAIALVRPANSSLEHYQINEKYHDKIDEYEFKNKKMMRKKQLEK